MLFPTQLPDIRPGAGAAGSSAAYHVSKFAATTGIPVNITIFERNTYIGGRSTTVDVYDDPSFPVELGASIFVQVNKILVDAVEEFNLSTAAFKSSEEAQIPGPALAVWDGERFVVTMQSGSGWWNTAKLLWKYGFAPIRTLNLMKATVAKFMRMYDEPIYPFASLTQAVQDVGLSDATALTGEEYMYTNGITGAFGHDIVQASTRVNYAQNLNHIHGLEAMVCMATDGAMAVEGGNWKIFEQMLKAAHATTVLETRATHITRGEDGSYAVSFKNDASGIQSHQTFDTVVLASPHQFSDLAITPSLTRPPDEIPYVQLHVTLFTSPHLLSPAFFDLPATQPVPKVVLTTNPASSTGGDRPNAAGAAGFFSISLIRSLMNPHTKQREYLYKIFSPSAPNATWLADLLGQPQDLHGSAQGHDEKSNDNPGRMISWLHRKAWDSYPYEYPRVTFEELLLVHDDDTAGEPRKGIWYTAGIESFISTMETSALMGRNIARLVVDSLVEQREKKRE